MAEYIEREAAIKAVRENDCEGYATWAVKAVPSADVAPVRHGYWIESSMSFTDGLTRLFGFKCSECAGFCVGESRYCPNCGARMDGAE